MGFRLLLMRNLFNLHKEMSISAIKFAWRKTALTKSTKRVDLGNWTKHVCAWINSTDMILIYLFDKIDICHYYYIFIIVKFFIHV